MRVSNTACMTGVANLVQLGQLDLVFGIESFTELSKEEKRSASLSTSKCVGSRLFDRRCIYSSGLLSPLFLRKANGGRDI
jgi:hypothetical protein